MLGGGGAAVGVSAYLGAPWWVFPCSVLCTAIAGVPAVLPQESEHRRDVMREFLRHRERMYRLRHERPTSRTTGPKDRMTAPYSEEGELIEEPGRRIDHRRRRRAR